MVDQFPTPFPQDPTEAFNLALGKWYSDFCKSPVFEKFENHEKEYSESIISDLTSFILYYQDCQPSDWTVGSIKHCLLIDFPRTLICEELYVYDIPTVLTSFFSHLQDAGFLAGADDIASAIDKMWGEYIEEMEDRENFSLRKGFLISAEEEGVDIEDEAALLDYFKTFGYIEIDGIEPEVSSKIFFILSSWIIPFSDSRYISELDKVPPEIISEIILTLAGFLMPDVKDPFAWEASDLVRAIKEAYIFYPMTLEMKNLSIPVIAAFFTFLAEEGLHPHAREIVDAIVPLHDQMIADSSKTTLGDLENLLMKHLIESGVDIEDESAIETYAYSHQDDILREILLSKKPDLMKEIIQAVPMRGDLISPKERKPVEISTIQKDRRQRYEEIIALTDQFCQERLDEEYGEISRRVAARLARKKECQMMRGEITIWAAGIIYAVGQINFLFDSSFEPYQSADDICQFFRTSKSTTSQKAKLIRDTVGMKDHWDPEFSTSKMQECNPFKDKFITKDGFII